jgi:hypothetical protein
MFLARKFIETKKTIKKLCEDLETWKNIKTDILSNSKAEKIKIKRR